jgi:hypothetical protein
MPPPTDIPQPAPVRRAVVRGRVIAEITENTDLKIARGIFIRGGECYS